MPRERLPQVDVIYVKRCGLCVAHGEEVDFRDTMEIEWSCALEEVGAVEGNGDTIGAGVDVRHEGKPIPG